MIHIIKNNKWVITSSFVCILFGLLTFFTFINRSFIKLNDYNFQGADIRILHDATVSTGTLNITGNANITGTLNITT